MSYTLGAVEAITATLTDGTGAPVDSATLPVLSLTDPTGAVSTPAVAHDGVGLYHADVTLSLAGLWRYRWETTGVLAPAEGTLEVSSIYDGAVSDIRDLRVLIPGCRRAIDGPQATAPDAPSTTLNDQEVLGLIADATAELILNTASMDGTTLNAFGNSLVVVTRDPFYKAPNAWATEQPRNSAQDAAILSQAALNHYFWMVKLLKIGETMTNEAVEWQYSLSANVIAAWMQYLIANRERAIAALQSLNVVMDSYISLVAERDRMAAAWLEPWVTEIGAPVPYAGGGGSGPLEYDFRFSTWG